MPDPFDWALIQIMKLTKRSPSPMEPPDFRARFAIVLVALLLAAPAFAAVSLPSGFTDSQVGGALSSPTAFAIAPDGRIFVCEQAGKLRVIKNGALLSTPFVTLTVDSAGERGLLGVAFDPSFATNHFVYVYYTAKTPAIHNRLSRFTANGDVAVGGSETILLELNNLSSATNHNGGCPSLRTGREALHRGRRERDKLERADAVEPARKAAPPEQGRDHSDGQPLLRDRQRGEPRDLGARASKPVHVLGAAGHGSDLHQRRGPEHLGRGRRWPCRRQLRLADDRRGDLESLLRNAGLLLLLEWAGRLCDHRRDLLQPRDGPVSEQLCGRLFPCRLLRRMDQTAGCRRVVYDRLQFRDRADLAGRPDGRVGWKPLLPGAGKHQRSPSHPVHCEHPSGDHRSPSGRDRHRRGPGDIHGQRLRDTAAFLPVAAQHGRHPGRDSRKLHDRRGPDGGQHGELPLPGDKPLWQRDEQRRHPDGHSGPSADGHDHRTHGRRHLCGRTDDQLHRHGDGPGGRDFAGERVRLGDRLSSRHTHAPVHCADGRLEVGILRRSHDGTHGRQRLVPHSFDRDGLRGPDAHDLHRRRAA